MPKDILDLARPPQVNMPHDRTCTACAIVSTTIKPLRAMTQGALQVGDLRLQEHKSLRSFSAPYQNTVLNSLLRKRKLLLLLLHLAEAMDVSSRSQKPDFICAFVSAMHLYYPPVITVIRPHRHIPAVMCTAHNFAEVHFYIAARCCCTYTHCSHLRIIM